MLRSMTFTPATVTTAGCTTTMTLAAAVTVTTALASSTTSTASVSATVTTALSTVAVTTALATVLFQIMALRGLQVSKLRILQGGFADVAEYDFYSSPCDYGGVYDDYGSCGCGDYGSGFIDGVGFGDGSGCYGDSDGLGRFGEGELSDNGFKESASEY